LIAIHCGGSATSGLRPASDSRGRRDDDHLHRSGFHYRLVRIFAVKPRAFGAPLRGFGA
jgi:hypothetical protein